MSRLIDLQYKAIKATPVCKYMRKGFLELYSWDLVERLSQRIVVDSYSQPVCWATQRLDCLGCWCRRSTDHSNLSLTFMRHKLPFPFLHKNEALLPFIQLCAGWAVGFTAFVFLNTLQEQAPEVVAIHVTRLMFSQYGSKNSIQFKFPCIIRG